VARDAAGGVGGAGEGRDVMDREAAGRNIQAAIARRREQFYLADLDWNVEGYRATFCQGPLTVRRSIDEGTAEDVAPAGEPATRALATILDEVRREFGAP
jgi:hypothetical protein